MPTVSGARFSARPLTAPSTVAHPLAIQTITESKWGIFSRPFWGKFNPH